MTTNELLFNDVEQELAITRRMLQAIPDQQLDWAPHKKSAKLGDLASHVADLPTFGFSILTTEEFDFNSPDFNMVRYGSSDEMVKKFDQNAAILLNAIKETDVTRLQDSWVLRVGENVLLNDNRYRAFRMFAMSHIAHHRAQLGVYLRLLDIPVPSVYGPTADN